MAENHTNHTLSLNFNATQYPIPRQTNQEHWIQERIQTLAGTLIPIPFKPTKALDFATHETLLRRIGLWDFVNVEFDPEIRVDLVAQLIGSYNPSLQCGHVNGARVSLNRIHLGRALRLPLAGKRKVETSEGSLLLEGLNFTESIKFFHDFMKNWVVLHEDDNACAMMLNTMVGCSDVLESKRNVREGRLDRVDWGWLMWSMVESELMDPALVKCYYASHLQLVIKMQIGELLITKEVPAVVLEDEEEKDNEGGGGGGGDVSMVELEGGEVEGVQMLDLEQFNQEPTFGMMNNVGDPVLQLGDVNVNGFDLEEEKGEEGGEGKQQNDDQVIGGGEFAEPNIELSLGFENVELQKGEEIELEKLVEGYNKEEELPAFDLEGSNVGEPLLHQYGLDEINTGFGFGEDKAEEGQGQDDDDYYYYDDEDSESESDDEEDKHEDIPLEGMNEVHHLDAMQVREALPFSPVVDLNNADFLLGEFPSWQDGPQMNSGPNSSILVNDHTHKRGIDQIDQNHDNNSTYNSSPDSKNKRQKLDVPNNNAEPPVDFNFCMDQIQNLMEKARSMHSTKLQICEESTQNEQVLLSEIHIRDNMIDSLRQELQDETTKGQREVYRLQKELEMTVKLVEGYKEALKGTKKAFEDYRSLCDQNDNEPYYRDVPGSRGLVVSAMELEKAKLEQQEQERMMRMTIEKQFKEFEESWIGKLEVQPSKIDSYAERLVSADDKVKIMLKDSSKGDDTPPTEGPNNA